MEKLKNLNRYQQAILILLIAMSIIFGVLFARATSKTGFLYMDKILEVSQEDGNTIYFGKIRGEDCKFVVTADKTVTFQAGERLYGPYTVKEDPTAIPEDDAFFSLMKGVEINKGNETIFRGGIVQMGGSDSYWFMVNEDGSNNSIIITATMSDGTVVDDQGNIFDEMEPSASSILDLVYGKNLESKGDWQIWFYGLIISIITTVSILFADELFRFNLAFQIRDADYAEPSEWEIASRYIGWTAMTIMTLVLYIMGLQ